jgi:hypothetical protein
MNVWCILAIVILVLFLIGQIRVGGQVEYDDKGVAVWVRVGPLRLQVFPRKEKASPTDKKKKKQRQAKQAKPKQETGPKPVSERVGGALEYVQAFLPIILKAVGQLYHKLQVDQLELELTAGAQDPSDAALRYGQANAALGALWYPLVEALHVKDGHARAKVDFEAQKMTLYAYASLSIKIGQILSLALYFGIKFLTAYLKIRKRKTNPKTEHRRKAA